ncbi:MAG: UDP-N-acetylmuramoyl-L-alanyl-D-glutamate--2,6-diaminopimelate ligase, partial [Sphingomonadales bacterium]|nr:UDP-N-acetylmuramoyl-L-alanyl-D-glutamate--2,6-diaminopimelate ligase [Sphingomonadales bacterium]
ANNKRLVTIGSDEAATIRLINCDETPEGYSCEVAYGGNAFSFNLPLIGKFQIENALVAAGMVLAEGVDEKTVFAAVENLHGVDGRMELAGVCRNGAPVLVDYAHTPDGLENALASLQSYRDKGRVLIVFGCGGDRDKGKRPIMGAIAEKLADKVFVTDDNPRSEDPKQIRAEVLAGAPTANEFDDRATAINTAVASLKENDILLVTGKGHEQGQIVGDKILPFSDLTAVKAAIKNINKTGAAS